MVARGGRSGPVSTCGVSKCASRAIGDDGGLAALGPGMRVVPPAALKTVPMPVTLGPRHDQGV
jgi:hypothetical protein